MQTPINTTIIALAAATWLVGLESGWSFYNPQTGRWLSRDPGAESQGSSLYAAAQNSLVSHFDYLGLEVRASVTYHSHSSVPGLSAGQTLDTANWPNYVAPIQCGEGKVKMTAYYYDLQCEIHFHGDGETCLDEFNPAYPHRTVKAHEEIHYNYYFEYAGMTDAIFAPMDDVCICKPCFDSWLAFARASSLDIDQLRLIKSYQLDIDDYRSESAKCYQDETRATLPNYWQDVAGKFWRMLSGCGCLFDALPTLPLHF